MFVVEHVIPLSCAALARRVALRHSAGNPKFLDDFGGDIANRLPLAPLAAGVDQVINVGLVPGDSALGNFYRRWRSPRLNVFVPGGLADADLAQNLAKANESVRFATM